MPERKKRACAHSRCVYAECMGTARFQSPRYGTLSLAQVIRVIAAYINELPDRAYTIAIGADSCATSTTAITTVVVVQRVGLGAIYFYTRSEPQTFSTMRDRIYAEAMSAVTLGQEIRSRLTDTLGEADLSRHHIEIHADIGQNGPMQEHIDAITGMMRGFDFTPVIKPDAYAACCVADRHA